MPGDWEPVAGAQQAPLPALPKAEWGKGAPADTGGWETVSTAPVAKPELPAGPSPMHAALSQLKEIGAGAKNNLEQIGGELASVADFVLSAPGQVVGAANELFGTSMALLKGESPKEAYKMGREYGQDIMGKLTNPVQKILEAIHVNMPHEGTVTDQGMQKITSVIDKAGEDIEKATGGKIPKESVGMFADELMAMMIGKGAEPTAKAIGEKLASIKRPEVKAKLEAQSPQAVDKEYTDWAHGLPPEEPPPGPPGAPAAKAPKPRIKLKLRGEPEAKAPERPVEPAPTEPLPSRGDKAAVRAWAAARGLKPTEAYRELDRLKKAAPAAATAAILGGAAADYVLDPEHRDRLTKALSLGGGGLGLAMALAVKPKGGMWHPEAVERLSSPLKDKLISGEAAAAWERTHEYKATGAKHPADRWAERAVRNYLNRYAGTAEDPLRDVEIPAQETTATWGELMDNTIKPWRVEGPRGMETQWSVQGRGAQSASAVHSYLSHVGDYLREHVPPAKLQQYDLTRAVKETAKWDKELAAKMNSVEGRLEGTVPFKKYPDGFQWVEVGKVDERAPLPKEYSIVEKNGEFYVAKDGKPMLKHERPGAGGAAGDMPIEWPGNFKTREEAEYAARRLVADAALKREGDVMGHCVGGYCDMVENEEARIFSLRDPKGASHVTIEVTPGKQHGLTVQTKEPDVIEQIKGKQNRAPNPEYLPYVQDFVRSGKWGEVGDLANAGMVDASQVRRYAAQRGIQSDIDLLDTKYAGQRYIPKRELEQAQVEQAIRTVGQGERGYVNSEIILGLASAGLGAAAGAYVDPEHPFIGAMLGGAGGLWLSHAGRYLVRGSPEEDAMVRRISDGLYTISKRTMERQIALIRYLKDSVPEDYAKYAKQIYDSFENPKITLSPEAQRIKDQIIEPIRKGNARIRKALEALGVDVGPEIQQGYVHRIAQGERPSIWEEIERSYPGHRGLTRTAPSLKERNVFALVGENGEREVITRGKKGEFTVWRAGKPAGRVTVRPGKPVNWKGQKWNRVEATTDEIEQHTPIRYYRDALGTELDNNVRLGRALENALFLDGLKKLPSFNDIAIPEGAQAPEDWRSVTIPQLRGYKFHPRIADILDDFSGEMAKHPAEAIGKVSRVLTGSLFWNPFPHIFNILDHSLVQRGFTAWVNPAAYPRLISTSLKAWRAVSEQNADYLHMIHEGAGLMYPNILVRNFGEQVMRQLGHVPEMSAVAKAFGYVNPLEMMKRVYGFSRKNLWFWNDVIMMQAYYERAQIRGLTLKDAFADVERHIPNYRIPDQVMGSRRIAQMLQSPFFTAFGRYDYGRLRSYGAMIKDLVGKGVPLRDRARALDQMAALTVAGFFAYPMILDKVAQGITGNPNASVQRFGANTIPWMLWEYFHDQRDLSQVTQSAFPVGQAMKLMVEAYVNRDLFSGSRLLDTPNDIPDFLAKQFNPLYIVGQVQTDKLSPQQFLWQTIGVKSPSSDQVERREKWRERERKISEHREARKKRLFH